MSFELNGQQRVVCWRTCSKQIWELIEMSAEAQSTVFDRLNDVNSYTGVYAERFRSGPGINASTGEGKYAT